MLVAVHLQLMDLPSQQDILGQLLKEAQRAQCSHQQVSDSIVRSLESIV
jgi:hypothetical protein